MNGITVGQSFMDGKLLVVSADPNDGVTVLVSQGGPPVTQYMVNFNPNVTVAFIEAFASFVIGIAPKP